MDAAIIILALFIYMIPGYAFSRGTRDYFQDHFSSQEQRDHKDAIKALTVVLGLLWPIAFVVYASFMIVDIVYSVLKVVLRPKWALSVWKSREFLKNVAPWRKPWSR
ncbi:hypothetical protein [Pseudomonas phage PaGz-1]|uniref:Uncharacterized protein n=1 Tax=Pseudomonas phage PaGz-1 TaxID=2419748 RepID=A0A411B959_9CAUD|nr:hypothetical protein QE322_gp008 [Pseudomonas phage PaGz-1]QAX98077.1 hypothetical protein [Pseudomonas phage PaGz-1]